MTLLRQPRSTRPASPVDRSTDSGLGAVVLALLVCAGQIKDNPLLRWIPLDLTLLLAVVAVLLAGLSLLRGKLEIPAVAVVFLLAIPFAIGVFNAGTSAYSSVKVITLLTITLIGLVLCASLLVVSERQRLTFVLTLATVGVVSAIYTLAFPETAAEGSNRLVFAGTDTIGTARLAGTAIIILACFALLTQASVRVRFWLWAAIVPLGVVLLATGSRGPLIAAVVALAAIAIASRGVRDGVRRHLGQILLIGAALAVWLVASDSDGVARTANFVSGGSDSSTTARVSIWEAGFDAITRNPLGIGWGNFRRVLDAENVDVRPDLVYPHNIVIEVVLEAGWIGGIIVMLVLGASLVRAFGLLSTSAGIVCFGLLVFTISNSLVSGDVNSARLLWALVGIVWGATPNQKPGGLAQIVGGRRVSDRALFSRGRREEQHPMGENRRPAGRS